MTYIFGIENWRKAYSSGNKHKNIWIVIETSKDDIVYLEEYSQWLTFKDYCKDNKLKINSIGLQYKSNLIKTDTTQADAVYLIRSVKGQMGGVSRDCYTIGIAKNGKVQKTMWLTPELIEDNSYEDDLENCFEEALIYNNA
ncbi:MAG: hypothetical protein EBU90_03730 [Proteobacteria bacterium]|nr:hypothetical protein [Pseudomonadota bacterium]NBP13664.1 hypothetical protein [bacterium]